ncbi:hypothetical protein [Streptomyces canus]|uniref:hypothetical protein n=1 Tax=Streptomyces canus TaxID=58343 RepID=UPI003F6D7E4C
MLGDPPQQVNSAGDTSGRPMWVFVDPGQASEVEAGAGAGDGDVGEAGLSVVDGCGYGLARVVVLVGVLGRWSSRSSAGRLA